MTDRQPPIGGDVAPGFERVRTAFKRNFAERDELGATCAVVYRGEVVVDLWGGYRDTDRTQPWESDTLVLLFSAMKGVAAAAMAHGRAEGLFAADDRVADHWPAFGQAGKREVTVRDLLGHRAGVAAIDGTLTPADVADRERLLERLAAKQPDWSPGERHGYHAWTLGWYESELLRRTDPAGRTMATYATDELFDPLDAEFYIGVPGDVPADRIADIQPFGVRDALSSLNAFPLRLGLALAVPWSTSAKALSPFDMSTPAALNEPQWRTLEIPAGNGVGRVRDLARLYGDLATGGSRVGLDRETFRGLQTLPPTPPPAAPGMSCSGPTPLTHLATGNRSTASGSGVPPRSAHPARAVRLPSQTPSANSALRTRRTGWEHISGTTPESGQSVMRCSPVSKTTATGT